MHIFYNEWKGNKILWAITIQESKHQKDARWKPGADASDAEKGNAPCCLEACYVQSVWFYLAQYMASAICCINILTRKKPLRLPRSRQPKVRTLPLPKKNWHFCCKKRKNLSLTRTITLARKEKQLLKGTYHHHYKFYGGLHTWNWWKFWSVHQL